MDMLSTQAMTMLEEGKQPMRRLFPFCPAEQVGEYPCSHHCPHATANWHLQTAVILKMRRSRIPCGF